MSYSERNMGMAEAKESTVRLDSKLLKQIARMYENGISIKDISQELGLGEPTAKRLLKLLGYRAAD